MFQGRKNTTDMRLTVLAALVLAMTLQVRAGERFVAPTGNDGNPGTKDQPFRTIQKGADAMKPGDTCWVRAGTYRETVRPKTGGREAKPIRFAAWEGEQAVLSGTEPIMGRWSVHQGKIYSAKTDKDFEQLFVDGKMMIEARWPNMRFEEIWDRSKWARAGKGSRYGKIVDPNLAKTGIDWTGARAMLNVAHQFFTWTRPVARHAAGSAAFEYAKDLEGITSYADKTAPWEDDYYFLSGKLEALDCPGEWFLDPTTHTLYLWTLEGDDPASHKVEAKIRNLAFDAKNADWVELRGIRFFAATFRFENCNHCVIEDCHLRFPSFARELPDGGGGDMATVVSGGQNAVRRCSLAYSAVGGLTVNGGDNRIENCVVHDVSWYGNLKNVAVAVASPAKAEGGELGGSVVRGNTVFNGGNALINYRTGHHTIEYNHVYDGGLLCKDVALVYTGQPSTAGSVVRYNWVHGCQTEDRGGLGIRGDDQTRSLTVHHNVVWDCGRDGIIVKGDLNKVDNNTVFDIGQAAEKGNSINMNAGPEPKKSWRKQFPLLDKQNANSQIWNNAAQTITGDQKGTPFPFTRNLSNNYPGENLMLADPAHFDFRPREASPLIDAGRQIPGITDGFQGKAPDIGAYEFGADPWKAGAGWTGDAPPLKADYPIPPPAARLRQ